MTEHPENYRLVTRHGEERLRKRMGASRKGAERRAKQAINKGMPLEEFGGCLRAFLEQKREVGKHYFVYGGHFYVFDTTWVLTTCYPVTDYKQDLARQLRGWKARKTPNSS